MKAVKIFSLAIALSAMTFSSNLYANNGGDTEPTTATSLKSEIATLVKSPALEEMGITSEEAVKVKFFVNSDKEIIVVNTGTDNSSLDSFLKSRLNYKKVKTSDLKSGVYNIKITFQAG